MEIFNSQDSQLNERVLNGHKYCNLTGTTKLSFITVINLSR